MKYLNSGKIDLAILKHDVAGLHGPLSYAKELLEGGDQVIPLKIQNDLLKKIESIVQEIENLQSVPTAEAR